jgi:hypothetical protein
MDRYKVIVYMIDLATLLDISMVDPSPLLRVKSREEVRVESRLKRSRGGAIIKAVIDTIAIAPDPPRSTSHDLHLLFGSERGEKQVQRPGQEGERGF